MSNKLLTIISISGVSLSSLQNSSAEEIKLYGKTFDLDIEENIPERPKTWSELKENTLKLLESQQAKAETLYECRKLILELQGQMTKEIVAEFNELAIKEGTTPEDIGSRFKMGEGDELSPSLQEKVDLLDGLYQVETAIIEKMKLESLGRQKPSINPFEDGSKNSSKSVEAPAQTQNAVEPQQKPKENLETPRLPPQSPQPHSMEW